MASVDDIVADLQSWTNAGTAILTSAVAGECVNTAMRRMARVRSWTFLTASIDLVIPGGSQNSVPLPLFFQEEKDVWTVDTTQADPGSALNPIVRTLRTFWYSAINPLANVDPQFPQVAAPSLRSAVTDARYYYLWDGQLFIVPTPTSPLTVRMDYVMSTDLVIGQTPGQQNGFTVLYRDAVRNGGLIEAARFLKQWETAAAYEDKFKMDLQDCMKHDSAQETGGASRQRGI